MPVIRSRRKGGVYSVKGNGVMDRISGGPGKRICRNVVRQLMPLRLDKEKSRGFVGTDSVSQGRRRGSGQGVGPSLQEKEGKTNTNRRRKMIMKAEPCAPEGSTRMGSGPPYRTL